MTNDKMKPGSIMVADIGGTHARFSLACDGRLVGNVKVLACRDHENLASAAHTFLNSIPQKDRPRRATIAVAAPVLDDMVKLTNLNWAFSTQQLRDELKLETLEIINDFTAVAWAVPGLSASECQQIGDGESLKQATKIVIGPGSGLGVAVLVPAPSGWVVVPTEGGHVTMAASTLLEDQILDVLRRKYGHVSAERVLSGPGLENIYFALGKLDGDPFGVEPMEAQAISALAQVDPSSRAGRALSVFCDFLGTAASNAALLCDARGGVYVAGGIVASLGMSFNTSGFRRRFESKGRFGPYLSKIPTYVIQQPFPALIGLAKGAPGLV